MQIISSFVGDGVMFIASGILRTTTQSFTCVYICDVLFIQCLLQRIFVVLGIETTVGCAAHVHYKLYAVIYQQLDEFINRMVAVPDRIKFHGKLYPLANDTAA